jgi:formyltetrahydrofolate synthetase
MKSYIDKVEKELKDKEIAKMNHDTWMIDNGNSSTLSNKPLYSIGIDPVETKKVYTEKESIKPKINQINKPEEIVYERDFKLIGKDANGKIVNIIKLELCRASRELIFTKYKDILTKEQIKELYKNG